MKIYINSKDDKTTKKKQKTKKQNKNDLYGRTTHNKVVNIKNLDDSNIGKLINVKITEATQNSLIGEQA